MAFFFFAVGNLAVEVIERETCRERERERSAVERERVRHINFLGLEISEEYIK